MKAPVCEGIRRKSRGAGGTRRSAAPEGAIGQDTALGGPELPHAV
ncbi:hypothetical protein [Leadbettera azotonutricia]|uniref:Uncharacterized protein n=1 Tax=Leadbettera azotonutricia (strain ATCC BAA-888 / DSM 13862 / ZAS-9) TaxID=545695 RepID=F5Y7P8_LEAAZ|nr:hypothetical protein [Leadbettera azotonutricia]AEF80677.1 hypothetical protein TREAZ_1030 [Leadbettera azotonutricia ZAS-9]